MIGYVTLGSTDLARATKFYSTLLAEIGARVVMSNERMTMFGSGRGQPMLAVCTPFDGKRATAGNGSMVALNVASQDAVRKLHAKALELGASDEGAPGARGAGFFGYFRDPDGNKLAAYVMG